MLVLKQFYRNYVTTDLRSPKIIDDSKLLLPKDCVIHYLSESTAIGPSSTEYPFSLDETTKIYMEDIVELNGQIGRPKQHRVQEVMSELRAYRQDNLKTFRRLNVPMTELPAIKLGVVNYSPLLGLYKYPRNMYSTYNKVNNLLNTLLSNMNNNPNKVNMLFVDLNTSGVDFSSAALSILARRKLDIIKRGVTSLLEGFMIEFMFYIIGKDTLISLLDNETKATTFFVFNRNGKEIITNLLTMERQLGNITDIQDIVKKRYTTRKVAVMSKVQKLSVMDNIFKVMENTDEETEDEETSDVKVVAKETPKSKAAKIEALADEINTVVIEPTDIVKTVDDYIVDAAVVELNNPELTPSQVKAIERKVKKANAVTSPVVGEEGRPLRDVIKLTAEDYSLKSATVIGLPETIPDDLKTTKLTKFDANYVRKIQKKQSLAVINSFSRSGALVVDVKLESGGSILGETDTYIIKFAPLDGVPSTVKIPMPKISEDGTFFSNGTKYRMSKQHVDLPIRKVSQYEVYLGSNFPSRLSVKRSSKAVDSLERWLFRVIRNDESFNVVVGDVFNYSLKSPNLYGMLSSQFRSIKSGEIEIDLNHVNNLTYTTEETDARIRKAGGAVCGKIGNDVLYINKDGHFITESKAGKLTDHGDVFKFFELPEHKAPQPLATITNLGKEYPIVIMLAHGLGLSKLIKHLNGKVVVQANGKRYKEPYDIRMRFEDVDVYVSNLTDVGKMILQGMVKLDKLTRNTPYADFQRVKGYPPEGIEFLILELGYPIRYAVSIDIIFKMFLDPITVDVLKDMKEPTNMVDLLIRAVDLLTTLDYPSATDSDYMRERGYERFPGLMYKAVCKKIIEYKTAFNPKNRNINLSPFEVFNNIIKDSTTAPTQDVNPLGSLKETELITYLGDGGRSRATMVAKSRLFHESDVGLLSEAVPDSGSTGINAYMSADPDISNLLGMHTGNKNPSYAGKYSTSFLNTPGLDKDNPNRAVMSHIQQSHVVGIKGSRSPPIKTGMEFVIPHRTSAMYSNMTELDGKVTEITEHGITVTHDDGSTKIYTLGVLEGKSEGKIYPHELITQLKVGDKVKTGDAISYNPMFFDNDPLTNKLLYKQGIDLPMCFLEGPEYHEDSCALWSGLSKTVESPILYKLDYPVKFKDSVTDMPKIGDKIEAGDVVMFIEDEITAGLNSAKKSKNNNTLQDLTRQAPKSEVTGTIHEIEVLYNGNVSDMSPSLAKLTTTANKRTMKKATERGQKAYNGATYGELRVGGKVIGTDELVVSIYIESKNTLLIGDKFVFASQLKATLGKLLQKPLVSQSGKEAYGGISFKAASNRMAPSAFAVSIANTILRELPIHLAKKHFGKDIVTKPKKFLRL